MSFLLAYTVVEGNFNNIAELLNSRFETLGIYLSSAFKKSEAGNETSQFEDCIDGKKYVIMRNHLESENAMIFDHFCTRGGGVT